MLRVRDLTLTKEDLRLYFTDGYMIFGKPIGDAPVSAVFVTSTQGGDGEILALPPNKSERQSLASYTASPNPERTFQSGCTLFTDETYRDLMAQIRENPVNKKSPRWAWRWLRRGPQSRAIWPPVSRSRWFWICLSGPRASQAFLLRRDRRRGTGATSMRSTTLRARQQITIGQIGFRDNRTFFDVWTAFESRSVRNGTRAAPAPEFELNDFRIDATLLPPISGLQVVTRVKVKPTSGSGRAFPFALA